MRSIYVFTDLFKRADFADARTTAGFKVELENGFKHRADGTLKVVYLAIVTTD